MDRKCPQSCVINAICLNLGGGVSGNNCIFCGSNSQWNGISCVCIANYYQINGVCSQCPANSTWNGNACTCLAGFNLVNGTCIVCPQLSMYIAQQQVCICLSGYYMINGACTACPPNSGWNGNACTCLSPYYMIGGVCQQIPPFSSYNGTSFVCLPNYYLVNGVCSQCPSKSSWNGTGCTCISGYFLIQGSCLLCDPNSSYDGNTCKCNPGYFGNFQLCTQCDPTCSTCSQAGVNACTSCPNGLVLTQGACGCGAGKVLQELICVSCPTNCISCSDTSTCTQCAVNYNLVQQIVNGVSIIGCSLPSMGTTNTPNSNLALTGTTIGNNVIYQGVTLSSLPAYFLTTNCANCSDLFLVLIIPNTLGITYSIDYVLYSQFWFVITFSYGSSGITPNFQFKVQLNFKYANYFTPADMAQGVFSQITSNSYPRTVVAANLGTFSSGLRIPSAPGSSSIPKS